MKKTIDYIKLLEISKQARLLEGVFTILSWDQETFMPPKASSIRAEQLATLSGLIHQQKTGEEFKQVLNKLIDIKKGTFKEKSLTPKQKIELKEWRKQYLKEAVLPLNFVEEFSKLTSNAIEVWKTAKKENAYQRFAPFLEKIVDMNRKKAEFLGYNDHPYDALLNLYEDDIKTKELESLFQNLQKNITSLLKKIQTKRKINDKFLFGKFDANKQLTFGNELLKAIGYDLEAGRLDLSVHPCSNSAHPYDNRITTKIHPTSLMSNIFAVLHEAGHGLYDMGLLPENYGSPLGEAISMAVHESQSRWWETRIGQSKAFWKYFLPKLKKLFPQLKEVSLDQFYKAINVVEPGLIRIEADEVTYSLHVILRFELEKDLIAGKLKVRDVPEAWNARMEQYLGISPKNNGEGCLQDIHWSMGAFGYFPSYTLGNLYAAQLFKTFEEENPLWKNSVEKGRLQFITNWLREKIHRHGKYYTGQELLKKVTGKFCSIDPYVDYLNTKYSKIYD